MDYYKKLEYLNLIEFRINGSTAFIEHSLIKDHTDVEMFGKFVFFLSCIGVFGDYESNSAKTFWRARITKTNKEGKPELINKANEEGIPIHREEYQLVGMEITINDSFSDYVRNYRDLMGPLSDKLSELKEICLCLLNTDVLPKDTSLACLATLKVLGAFKENRPLPDDRILIDSREDDVIRVLINDFTAILGVSKNRPLSAINDTINNTDNAASGLPAIISFILHEDHYKEVKRKKCHHTLGRDGIEMPLTDREKDFISSIINNQGIQTNQLLSLMGLAGYPDRTIIATTHRNVKSKFKKYFSSFAPTPLITDSGHSQDGYRINILYSITIHSPKKK